ncbi:MAG TPA: SAP domain-containing protein, partial [Candidatus Limosilactobacillus intestinavium]|nr:SAP domain-containing protein [Candidatus Limosilactobacillus intestinavium]
MGDFLKIIGWILLGLFAISLVIAYWYVFLIVAIIVAILWWFKAKKNKSSTNPKHAKVPTNGPSTVIKSNRNAINNNVTEQDSKLLIKNNVQSDEPSTDPNNTEFENSDDNIKLADNLYLGDILFLNWLNGKEINEPVPGYIVNTFNINPIVEKRKLKSGNYIKEGSIGWRLNKLKVTDLKTILRNNNKKVLGRKKDLIQRIQDNI